MMFTEKELLGLQNGSDVRGVAMEGVEGERVNLNSDAAELIATGFAQFLSEQTGKSTESLKIAVGHDSRLTAEILQRAVMNALQNCGVSVLDCSLASTPAMYMSIVFKETACDGAIMLTASHLPFNRNGLKFFTRSGGLEKTEITEVLRKAFTWQQLASREGVAGIVQKFDLLNLYSAHLRKKICEALGAGNETKPLEGMHIIVDAGNGAGGFFASQVLALLGADITGSQFLEPDGRFPNHIPNPESAEAMASVSAATLRAKADLGLIFDTDVDRMSAVLPNGREVNRNALIAMMAAILAPEHPGGTIVTDSVTSDELTEFLQKNLGLKHHRFKRGYKNVIDECVRLNSAGEDSPLAIETSGHGALSENYYLDDGAYLAVKLIIAATRARRRGSSLEALIAELRQPAEGREYRLKILGVKDYNAYGEKVLEQVRARASRAGIKEASPSYEGVRLIFPQGWALLRMSLHDPQMPLNVESRETGGIALIAAGMRKLLDGCDALNLEILR